MSNENDKFNDIYDFFLILDPQIADIDRIDEQEEGKEEKEKKIKLMKKIEERYTNGIKSFGERMFHIIENDKLELNEMNIGFTGDLSTKLNFGVFQIGAGTGISIAFKIKKK
ncbi:MAG: hypothetical protein ACFFDH_07375 [Promethearchaeota archaeon]